MKRDKGKMGVGRARGWAAAGRAARNTHHAGGTYDGPAGLSLVRSAKISFFSASCFFHNFCIVAPNELIKYFQRVLFA
jgi:hypothetical protein